MSAVVHPSDLGPPGNAVLSRGRLSALVLGPAEQATWVRPAFLAVTLLAAFVYLWNLTISGWANAYYSMAAQAASQSWSAWFFGSLDSANFITLDKPPLSTMLMGLSVRVLGLSSWSVLLPQALAGVATVVVLYRAVRRSFGPVAATIAGVVMALMPVSVLIFRYDDPDALLTLLLVAAAAALLRALEDERMRWVVAAAALVGLGFLTKYLQAYLVLPAFAMTYGITAAGGVRHRVAGLAVALATVVVASSWWVAIVELVPTTSRPFIGGSTTNSVVELIFGYDGFGRIFGGSGPGPAGGPGGGANFSGEAGLLRLFNAEFGGQIAWLIPFAVVALVTGLWSRRHAERTDRAIAGYLLWGAWLVTHVVVFSFMSGIVHTYYAVALAPAIAALVGAGSVELWHWRARSWVGGLILAATVLSSAALAWGLLERTPEFAPGLGWAILAVGGVAALILAVPAGAGAAGAGPRRVGIVGVSLAAVALLAGPVAYAADTVGTAYGGGDPAAGPTVAGSGGFPGRGGSGPGSGVPDDTLPKGPDGALDGAVPGGGAVPSGGVVPGGFGGGFDGGFGGAPGGGRPGGPDVTTDQAVIDYLVANRGDATWLVAVSGSGSAAPIQLATGQPVMSMGGFSGSDASPTLEALQRYVASGELRFVLIGSGPSGPGGSGGPAGPGGFGGGSSEIRSWVTGTCTPVDIGGTTIYDCAGATVG